jgi:hypothetical protein
MSDKPEEISVFGIRPLDSISLPNSPYAVRLNCKLGGIFVGGQEDVHRRTKSNESVEIAIVKVRQFYGSLGQEFVGQWLQVFFIAGVSVDPKVLPKNTVCVFYLKKQNISNLFTCVQDSMTEKDPGVGIFSLSFEKQAGKDGSTYYTVAFGWRPRAGAEESKQLKLISSLLSSNPKFVDLEGTRAMQCIEGLSAEEVSHLAAGNDTEKSRLLLKES